MAATRRRRHHRRPFKLIAAGVGALATTGARAGDSSVDFKFLHYGEQDGRTKVENPEIYFTHDFGERGNVALLLSYDAISGASPTGEAPTADATTSASGAGGSIPQAQYTDTRRAIAATYARRFGTHLPSVTLSYSRESDYLSRGASLSDSWDLNGGRSTLHFGAGATSDVIDPANLTDTFTKKGISFSAGWTQVLGPRDLVDFSVGLDKLDGYLTDPYKVVSIGTATAPEARPSSRSRRSAIVKYGHYFMSRAALKASYRYYWDDWSIKAHTIDLQVDRRVGSNLIVTPRLRFYQQGAASFFAYQFTAPQTFMSGDYRLSSFWSWLAGIGLTVELSDRVSFKVEAAYQRQTGLDRIAPLPTTPLLLTKVSTFETENEGGEGPGTLSAADLNTITGTFGFSFKF